MSFRLKAGFAIKGDDPPLGYRPFQRPEFFDDADPVVGNVAQAEELASGNDQYDRGHDPQNARRQPRVRGCLCKQRWQVRRNRRR